MKLIIKIGGNMKHDLKEVWENPKKAELDTHTLYVKDAAELSEILSPKKLELLLHTVQCRFEKKTLGELATELKRKQEAVSRDAGILAECGLIQKTKERQMVFLKPKFDSIEIRL